MSKKVPVKATSKGIKDKFGIVSSSPPPKPQVVKTPISKGKK